MKNHLVEFDKIVLNFIFVTTQNNIKRITEINTRFNSKRFLNFETSINKIKNLGFRLKYGTNFRPFSKFPKLLTSIILKFTFC